MIRGNLSRRKSFTLRLHGKVKFHLGKAGQFSTFISLDFLHVLLIVLCKHVLKYCFILLRQVEKLPRENFIRAKQDSIKQRSCLVRMKLFTCSCRVYLMRDNGRKRRRQEVVYQQKN